jgi:hypothetical protein
VSELCLCPLSLRLCLVLSNTEPAGKNHVLTHVMRLAAHSTTAPTPTAMGQSFIMTL